MILQTSDFYTLPAGVERLSELLDLYRQCEDFLALGPNPNASEEMVLKDLELSRPEGGIYQGIYTGQPTVLAGVLDVIPANYEGEPGTAFIELLMIAAPYRGRGLGTRVVAELEKQLRAAGVSVVRAGVQVNNLLAKRFWLRRGYEIVGPAEDFPDGTSGLPLRKKLVP